MLRFGSPPPRCARGVCSGATLKRRFRRPRRQPSRHASRRVDGAPQTGRTRACADRAGMAGKIARRSVLFADMQAGRLARSLSLLQREAPRALRRAASAPGTVLRAQAPAPLHASAVRAGARAGVRGGVCISAGSLPEAVRCGSPRPRRCARVATPQPQAARAVAAALASFLVAPRPRAVESLHAGRRWI